MVTNGLTVSQEKQLVTLLGKVGAQWSEQFFHAMCSRLRLPTIDLVLVHKNKVFMTQRSANDKFDPLRWHFPGTVLRKTDMSDADALMRIATKELGFSPIALEDEDFLETVSGAVYIGHTFSNAVRGPEINRYFLRYVTHYEAAQLNGFGEFIGKTKFKKLDVIQHHRDIKIWDKI